MSFQYTFPTNSPGGPGTTHNSSVASSTSNMNPWLNLPTPAIPWTVIRNRPDIVKFGHTTEDPESWGSLRPNIKPCKRRSEYDFNPKPTKVHVSEEKMAAQMKNMHISPNQDGEQEGFSGIDSTEPILPTLVLSSELEKLPVYTDIVLHPSFLNERAKNAKALVLWKPPAGSLTSQLISNLQSNTEEEVDSVNNNTYAQDLNTMTEFGGVSTEMEL